MDIPDDTMITLIVKTPNLDVKDQEYECNKNWTVKSLKVYLSDVYPTKPNIEDQRLIYFGHLLSDNLLLREVLNVNNSKTHTVHLVCPPVQKSSIMNENSTKQGENISTSIENSASEETVATESSPPVTSGYYLRNGDFRSHLSTLHTPLYPPGYMDNATDFTQHAVLMQQMYMQYMAQCFQYAQSTGMYVGATTNQSVITETPPPVSPQNVSMEQVRTNAAENIQNRPVRNEAEVPVANRDMLDMLYILSRITVLLSVIYFYSSLGRCLFVIGLGCLIYIYRLGLFSLRRERHRNEGRHQLVQPRRNTSRHEPITNRNRSRTTHGPSPNLAVARHRRNGQVTAVKTFVASFFSSLIPDQHHPVNVN